MQLLAEIIGESCAAFSVPSKLPSLRMVSGICSSFCGSLKKWHARLLQHFQLALKSTVHPDHQQIRFHRDDAFQIKLPVIAYAWNILCRSRIIAVFDCADNFVTGASSKINSVTCGDRLITRCAGLAKLTV
jgi:hypothetical protein